MGPTYDYRKTVTLGETNALGNVYFAEFFSLQGVVREMWVRDRVPNGVRHMAEGLVLSTKAAHCEYRKPFYPFETIVCRMHLEEVRRVSAKLVFEYYDEASEQLRAFGWQLVVFKDGRRRTCRAPADFLAAAREILWPSASDPDRGHPRPNTPMEPTRP